MTKRSAVNRSAPAFPPDSLTTYLQEISRYPLLSRSEEMALARRARDGDKDALEHLICANLRFVVSVAKKYQVRSMSLSDLINEGNLGLIRAAERFDEEKGVRFISYAVWWVRQAIFQALAEHAHTVRVPLSRAATLQRIRRECDALRQELGRDPTQLELATELDVSEDELVEDLPLTRSYVSLDAPLAADTDATLLDYLPDDAGAAPDEDTAEMDVSDSVRKAVTQLRGRESRVLRLYFGLDGNEPRTLESIGALLGVTRERARQIKERGLSHLRKSDRSGALASLCGR